MVIRNVVLVHLKDGVDDATADRIVDALLGLQIPGMLNLTCGRDAGLREGNAQLALVADFEDEDAYRAYDADVEHNRIRREIVAPAAERTERAQYRI